MKAILQSVHPVLAAHDVAQAVAFYRWLGFALVFQDDPAQPRYVAVVRDGVELHIQWADAGQWAHALDRPVYRFPVSDVDALYREFVARGAVRPEPDRVSLWAAPGDTPRGAREFRLRDPGQNGLLFYRAR